MFRDAHVKTHKAERHLDRTGQGRTPPLVSCPTPDGVTWRVSSLVVSHAPLSHPSK